MSSSGFAEKWWVRGDLVTRQMKVVGMEGGVAVGWRWCWWRRFRWDEVMAKGGGGRRGDGDEVVDVVRTLALRMRFTQSVAAGGWCKMETKDTLSSCSNSEEQQMQQIQDKAKKSCMVSFRQLHSHLKLLSNNDLQGTRIESGFKRAFATLFGQDIETFTCTMFLYMDQLEKQLDKEEFQEIGSMASFK
ncbi:hypothetical protein Tco_1356739, partial [Tanacetum coccineum]